MIVSQKKADEAWAVLRVYWPDEQAAAWPLTEDKVKEAYRVAARRTHPDAGGTMEAFAAVDRAKHVLLAWLERQGASEAAPPHGGVSVCPRCNGKRTIDLQKGFRTMKVQCPTCHGNGEIYDEKDKGVDRQ